MKQNQMDILIEERYVLEYIRDTILSSRANTRGIGEFLYHHNTCYEKAPFLIRNGILSPRELAKLKGRELTEEELLRLNDDYHANGLDFISLAVVGLPDVREDRWEYDPFHASKTDILISKEVKAGRHSINYENEFLAPNKIENVFFRSIDLRLLSLILSNENKIKDRSQFSEQGLLEIVKRFNCIKEMALAIQEMQLDLPIREMSFEEVTLDSSKFAKSKRLVIK